MIRYDTLKSILFKLSPETAHTIAGFMLKTLASSPPVRNPIMRHYFVDDPILHQRFFEKTFLNPVGLAAGFDKNGAYIEATPALGFGFTEVGTVTPKPQEGNPKPRLFRLIEDEAIQNAMGFNNQGAKALLDRLRRLYFFDYPIGINIGKNKLTPEEDALRDYETLFKTFRGYGTYMTVNISSPNTPGLRSLQNESFIKEVFALAKKYSDKPVLLKIAPDMSEQEAVDLALIAVESGAQGIIATNTTTQYALARSPNKKDFGGISGKPLQEKSYRITRALGEALQGKSLLISVGGIDSAKEALRRIKAGASLVQLYTPLIYHGPALVRQINTELIGLLKKEGFSHISEAIGSEWR